MGTVQREYSWRGDNLQIKTWFCVSKTGKNDPVELSSFMVVCFFTHKGKSIPSNSLLQMLFDYFIKTFQFYFLHSYILHLLFIWNLFATTELSFKTNVLSFRCIFFFTHMPHITVQRNKEMERWTWRWHWNINSSSRGLSTSALTLDGWFKNTFFIYWS